MTTSFIPVLILLAAAIGLGAVFLGLNWIIGRHQRTPGKLAPYESGVPLLDTNRKRVNVRFYQIAMLFILFDIEAAFLYPWAITFRGFAGQRFFVLAEMAVFLGILVAGFLYLWWRGALEWE